MAHIHIHLDSDFEKNVKEKKEKGWTYGSTSRLVETYRGFKITEDPTRTPKERFFTKSDRFRPTNSYYPTLELAKKGIDWGISRYEKMIGTKDSSKPNIHGLFQKQALERGAKGSGIFLYEQAGSHTAYYTKASAQKNVNEFNNEPIFVGPDKGKLPKDVYNEFQKAKFFEYTPAECKAELEKMNG